MPVKVDWEKEHARLEAMRSYEREYGIYGMIAGVDEAGRGPLAGPVVAAAVILPPERDICYLNDSKKVTEKRRELLFAEIQDCAIACGVGIVGPEIIDEINILQATYRAMRQAIRQLSPQPAILLNDAVKIPEVDIPQVPIIKGDAKSVNIAAASIVAKVTRDRMLRELDERYPGYGFARHKGYGTAEHIAALRQLGPCPVHRRSFLHKLLQNG